ncbi:Hypothetical predicted protein [Octopus vulgaris]|uniref:Uncharacterized protein n=1 Tax=Octopus vulgaris TaxID=6645 RepID=A0AA36FKC0_OCTVU|nr:Hypothetical predicted protein [Octopus vulgaris]
MYIYIYVCVCVCVFVCLCLSPQYRLTTDAGVFTSPSLSGSAKEADRISTGLTKNKCRGRFARLKAVLQHGRSQMTETSKKRKEKGRVYTYLRQRAGRIFLHARQNIS